MTLYLSKVYIHADICPYSKFPTDRQKMHSFVYSLFGAFAADNRVLWSDETERMCRRMTKPFAGKIALILSSQPPRIPADAEAWCRLETNTVKPEFLQHHLYAFTLQANCSFLEKHSGRIKPIKDPDKLMQWLNRQLQHGGCTLLSDSWEITGCSAESFLHINDSQDNPAENTARRKDKSSETLSNVSKIYLNIVSFRGVLCVKDHEAFAKMFSHGLGKAKAYGCGMLQLVPIATELE